MYFRKTVAKKTRALSKESSLQGRAVAHDFLGYLADRRDYGEALSMIQVGTGAAQLLRRPFFGPVGTVFLLVAVGSFSLPCQGFHFNVLLV